MLAGVVALVLEVEAQDAVRRVKGVLVTAAKAVAAEPANRMTRSARWPIV